MDKIHWSTNARHWFYAFLQSGHVEPQNAFAFSTNALALFGVSEHFFLPFFKCSLQINLPKLSQIPLYSWCHGGKCTGVDCPQWLFVNCVLKYICEWLLHTSIITKPVISTVHQILLENFVNLYKYTCSGPFLQCCMRFFLLLFLKYVFVHFYMYFLWRCWSSLSWAVIHMN